ncbi:hypothetical protein A4G19_10850 [Pasteurellaceae bacterium Macca]|nr:hypothetical protein [Pasteurellaceae bacterium Macca]
MIEPNSDSVADNIGGYIYCGAKCLEKTAPAFSRPNALAHLNRRIRYWNKKKRLNIPLIEEQTHD